MPVALDWHDVPDRLRETCKRLAIGISSGEVDTIRKDYRRAGVPSPSGSSTMNPLPTHPPVAKCRGETEGTQSRPLHRPRPRRAWNLARSCGRDTTKAQFPESAVDKSYRGMMPSALLRVESKRSSLIPDLFVGCDSASGIMLKYLLRNVNMRKPLTKCDRSETMRRVRSSGTSLEMELRRNLWRAGLRYRIKSDLLGKPDIVFTAAKVAVFIDSCFWHGCELHCRVPTSNLEYWPRKIERNRCRDRQVTAGLEATGWKVIRIWEHDIRSDIEGVVNRISTNARSNND